jgi:dTDP-4-amino-4,6-dideoxygalactose transaminase
MEIAVRFEAAWAGALSAKHCLATASGTTALFTTLNALGVGPGDEVIQGALLEQQLTRLEAQSETRTKNAHYLTRHLDEIRGISPARLYEGCTRSAYHLYMFHYDPEEFAGLPRQKFIKALAAEGIPSSSGYGPLNKEPVIENIPRSRHYRKCFSEAELGAYHDRIHYPANDQLCQDAVWFTQTILLGTRNDMDQIVDAVRKVQKHASDLKRA